MITEILLALSLVFNVVLVLYSRHLLDMLKNISIDLYTLKGVMGSYIENLSTVYESEMFYGEPVLENLVEHSKAVSSEISETISQYDFQEVEQFLEEDPEEASA